MLVYDIEIVKGILGKNEERLPGIEYCAGWGDHANMGVSVICAYDYDTDRYRVFCADNIVDFVELARSSRPLVGFNSLSFDDRVLAANGNTVTTEYDLLVELWRAAGLSPTWGGMSHAGFPLDKVAKANGLTGKTGSGALAPVLWQRGQYGQVIDYCLEDVRLTKKVLDRVLRCGSLNDPRDPSKMLTIRRP